MIAEHTDLGNFIQAAKFEGAIAEDGGKAPEPDNDLGPFVAAVRFEITGMVSGRPAIVVEHVTRLRGDLRPDWAQPAQPGGSYRVEITGEPSYAVDICPTSGLGDHNHAAISGAAGRIVNAIPSVIAAPPGIRTTLDLPVTSGVNLFG